MVGRDGMLGVQLVTGVRIAPLHALVQGSGSAWRSDASAFKRELVQSAALRHRLSRYTFVLMLLRGGSEDQRRCARLAGIGGGPRARQRGAFQAPFVGEAAMCDSAQTNVS